MAQRDSRPFSAKQQEQHDADGDDSRDNKLQQVTLPYTPSTVIALKYAEITRILYIHTGIF